MFCPHCGKQLPDKASFCSGCGAPLRIDPTVIVKPPQKPSSGNGAKVPPGKPSAGTGAKVPPVKPVSGSGTKVPPAKPGTPVKKKSGNGLVIAAIVMVILTVAVLIVGAIWLLQKDGEEKNGPGQTATQQTPPAQTVQTEPSGDTEPENTATAETTATEPEHEVPATTEPPVTTVPEETVPETTVPETTAPTEPALPDCGPYLECFQKYSDYVLPNSNSAYLGRRDVVGLNDAQRWVALQEIYARHGKAGADPHLKAYFEGRSWFTADASPVELNTYEEANVKLLQVLITQTDGSLYTSGNPYVNLQKETDRYLIPGSDTRYLIPADVAGMSLEQLQLARNEIFARRGYLFGDAQLLEYFYTKDWYVPTTPASSFESTAFSDIERSNIDYIRVFETRVKGVSFSDSNPFKSYYDPSRDYVFPQSSTTLLSEADVWDKSWQELSLGRNEILARYGYTFSDRDLLEYFLHYSWYIPATPPGKTDLVALNTVEQENSQYLRQWQNVAEELPDLSQLDGTMSHRVECDQFYMTVPVYWQEYAEITVQSGSIVFREKLSKQTDYGGWLFTVAVYSSESEYAEHPDYRVLSVTTDAQGNQRHLVVTGPTDVQFCPPAAELYTKMYAEREAIWATAGLK